METAMTTLEPRYLSYMLRLWQVRDDDELLWRASLEMLVAFLREETRADDNNTRIAKTE